MEIGRCPMRPFFMAARNSGHEMLFGKSAGEHLFGNALLAHKKKPVFYDVSSSCSLTTFALAACSTI